MSDLSSKATVELLINGQQAQQTLQQLRQNALQLETAISKAAATGNKTDLKRLRKELTDTKRQIREIESATQQVEHVLKNMDRATPKELNRSLQTLNHQLEYIERGSDAWRIHVEKIKRVKGAIREVNMQLRETEGVWQRMNRKVNDWQTSIMAGAAAVSGLVMAGRSAVKAYAEMEEELANTRKYTGMTEEAVEKLNSEFKKMDTRTSREQLNELAQEAGRLGKNTMEDVKGYVEAADIINVALVDLGEGATQTIAKLTDIFGVSEIMGTRDAMLAVGSTVNVLSQNCTAAKPYLVQFAQRMAGVGAQADLTIPQLLAFGATLDANGQKVEMSASALGKLTMNLFQKPKEIARQVGLDVEQFNETLKRSTFEGLMLFLQRIHDLGSADGLAVLAPMFKDLGMDGVRMSQVLSTLAEHLDMVRWETEEANRAFNEATSATNEYMIFNNTVQAGLDKAKKRIQELAVQLGEQLLPVMRHVYSSTTLLLKFLSTSVSFIIKYKEEIAAATVAFAAYAVVTNLAAVRTKVATAAMTAWNVVVKSSNVVMTIAQVVMNGLRMTVEKYVLHTKGATTAQMAFNRSLVVLRNNALAAKAAYGLVAMALTAVAIAIIQFVKRQTEEAKVMMMMNDIRKGAAEKMADERVKLDLLLQAAQNEKLSLDERQKAINELNRIVPDYNAQLDRTSGKYIANKVALDEYLKSMVKMYEIMGAKEQLQVLGKQKADLTIQKELAEEKVEEKERAVKVASSPVLSANSNSLSTPGMKMMSQGVNSQKNFAASALVQAKNELKDINSQLDGIAMREEQIMRIYGEEMQKSEVKDAAEGEVGEVNQVSPKGMETKAKEERFLEEKKWKEKEEAINRISYATGQVNYEEYQHRILDIEREYQQKILEHTDLTEQEQLNAKAAYYESVMKMSERMAKYSIEEEEMAYQERVAMQKQRYIDGAISYEVYEEAVEQLEIEHLRTMTDLYEDGSKEQLQAQRQLQDKLLNNQRKHQKELEEAEKKHMEAMSKMKERVFGDNPEERKIKYEGDLALLTEVYNREIIAAGNNAKEKLRIEKAFLEARAALMEQYNIEGNENHRVFLQKWNEDIIEFLESDFGKAVAGAMDSLVSGMAGIFQQLTTILQSEISIQTSDIEKRYEREISLAEGNGYRVKILEKQKEKEIANIKNEANRKMFAMQVIQAVAQTATNAINAYGSAAAIPVVGYIMAPIAAATAVATGMLQVAAIKKQQQAAAAQGYARGGFTRKGRKNEVAGVVHAGEWVASQELIGNPVARPIINALEVAQRTNSIGALRAEDVSRTITAPHVMAEAARQSPASPQVVIQNDNSEQTAAALAEYAVTMRLLKERLDMPFLTVNSVTGETGMKQAQDEYDKLIRNKSPKSRRS
ncbi:MAG: phage tail tape measure protein [Bacteroidaceae bacterium]|nr:phage tail tape measure protein [Bacteroidaceae bacterium]